MNSKFRSEQSRFIGLFYRQFSVLNGDGKQPFYRRLRTGAELSTKRCFLHLTLNLTMSNTFVSKMINKTSFGDTKVMWKETLPVSKVRYRLRPAGGNFILEGLEERGNLLREKC